MAALAVGGGAGLWWRGRDGRVRPMAGTGSGTGAGTEAGAAGQDVQVGGGSAAGAAAVGELSSADLGESLGQRATLVQFSTAFCAPCRATRQVLGEVARMVDGVRHVEIDAESRLDLVRRLDVRRTPTTFVLGPDGQVTHRASGQPRKADVIAALGAMIEFPT